MTTDKQNRCRISFDCDCAPTEQGYPMWESCFFSDVVIIEDEEIGFDVCKYNDEGACHYPWAQLDVMAKTIQDVNKEMKDWAWKGMEE